MSVPVKVLMVEDSEDDAKLTLRVLRAGGFAPTSRRVQTAEELEAALAAEPWDAVISDYSMPGFNGMDALRICRSGNRDLPFILVSGTIGEEIAVEAMTAGAGDYLMKDHLSRLAPALERELREAHVRADHRRAQRELIESRQRLNGIINSAMDGIVTVDEDSRIALTNPAAEKMFGYAAAELLGRQLDLLIPARFRSTHAADIAAFDKSGVTRLTKDGVRLVTGLRRNGEEFPLEASISRDESTGRRFFTAILRDVTERQKSEERIRRLDRIRAVLSGINGLIVRTRGRDELFQDACRIAVEKGGFRWSLIAIADKEAPTVIPVASAGMDDALLGVIERLLGSGKTASPSMVARSIREKRIIVANAAQSDPQVLLGRQCAEAGVRSVAVLPLIVEDAVLGVFALYSEQSDFFDAEELGLLNELAGDIAFAMDHIAKQERLDYLAYYDALTGLANRRLFFDRLAQYMRNAADAGHKLALFVIDLERFKNINDNLGRAAGDALLVQVAQWLAQNAGAANALARLDADHFAVVLPDVRQDGDVTRLLEKTLTDFLAHPFRLDDAIFRVAVKVGGALFPDDGGDAESLFKHAEAALKRAKASGERYLLFDHGMTETLVGRPRLESQLRLALENSEFVLHYQPKVNLATGRLTGAEALIRWNDPRTGLVPPGRFIPVLEETGLIHEVGRWALQQALRDYVRWSAGGLLPPGRIAVNVSALQLRHRGFIDEIRQVIEIDPRAAAGLELEITESMIMEDVKHSIATLQAIRALGVTIAIDDFGTGFSSLSYLARLPVNTLKIDRSFVIEMTESPEGLTLVSTMINLAHAMKLKVVAEGVETEAQSRMLKLLDCDEMQGFLFCKPVPAAVFEAKFLSRPAGA